MSVDAATLEDLGRELGEQIANSPEHEAFVEANEAVENDAEAQEMIQEFEELRHEFMLDREAGRADRQSMREVQEAQRELHSLPVMEAYLDAQEELQQRLATVNEAILNELAVDFGGEAGGCCQDCARYRSQTGFSEPIPSLQLLPTSFSFDNLVNTFN